MLSLRWLRDGRSARGTPSSRWRSRRPGYALIYVLPVLTVVVLTQPGCQSDFFGPCGPCANSPLRRLRERVFNRVNCLSGDCPSGAIVSDVPVVEGAPAVIAPAPAPR